MGWGLLPSILLLVSAASEKAWWKLATWPVSAGLVRCTRQETGSIAGVGCVGRFAATTYSLPTNAVAQLPTLCHPVRSSKGLGRGRKSRKMSTAVRKRYRKYCSETRPNPGVCAGLHHAPLEKATAVILLVVSVACDALRLLFRSRLSPCGGQVEAAPC